MLKRVDIKQLGKELQKLGDAIFDRHDHSSDKDRSNIVN